MNKVIIYGAGYVGLTLGIFLAKNKTKVIFVENDKNKLKKLRNGICTIFEKNIENEFKKNISKFEFLDEIKFNKNDSNFIFITFSYFPNKFVNYSNNIKKMLISKKNFIMIRSTLPVGFFDKLFAVSFFKKFSNNIVYCPERTLSGDALNELKKLPQIIGGNEKSIKIANGFFKKYKIKTILVKNISIAEFIKIYTNFARMTVFNLSNFAGLFSNLFEYDTNKLLDHLKNSYSRLNFISPFGPGVGGFCLPKDTKIMQESITNLNIFKKTAILKKYPLINYKMNNEIIDFYSNHLIRITKIKDKILFLGIAFKGIPETNDIRGSVGIKIIKKVIKSRKNISYYDFVVKKFLNQKVNDKSILSKKYNLIVILNNHTDYKKIANRIKNNKTKVIDFWK
jgi:UDP-N-acetyl-D-mannosaminuronic acid dehydrogenase